MSDENIIKLSPQSPPGNGNNNIELRVRTLEDQSIRDEGALSYIKENMVTNEGQKNETLSLKNDILELKNWLLSKLIWTITSGLVIGIAIIGLLVKLFF